MNNNDNSKFLINNIKAREILDSNGNPTIEVDIYTKDHFSRASVPSGSSVGFHEAFELRDKNNKRYNYKGVYESINNILYKIKPLLIGVDVRKQQKIDNIMINLDNSINKSNIGSNTILAVSMATLKAAS